MKVPAERRRVAGAAADTSRQPESRLHVHYVLKSLLSVFAVDFIVQCFNPQHWWDVYIYIIYVG